MNYNAARPEIVKIGQAVVEGQHVGDGHLADRGFCSDMNQLLRVGIKYDPQKAVEYLKTNLLALLPAC